MSTPQRAETVPESVESPPGPPRGSTPWTRFRSASTGLSVAGLWIGGCVGALAVGGNRSIASAGDGVTLWGWVVLAYLAIFVSLGLALGLIAALAPPRLRNRVSTSAWSLLGLLAFLGYSLGSRAVLHVRPWATEVDRSSIAAGLGLSLLILCMGAGCLQWRGSRLGKAWLAAPFAAFLLSPIWTAFRTSSPEPSSDEAIWDLDPDSDPGPVVLIGIDGADPKDLDRLLEEGRLPHLASLVDRGTLGPLETIRPTWSPIIWNTIATGQPGEDHRILDFTEIPIPGVSQGVQGLRVVERLAQERGQGRFASTPGHVGLTPMVYGLVRRQRLKERPIRAHHRRVKSLWNMLSDVGIQIGVVGWWATSPAERVDGWLVGDEGPRHHALRLRDPEQPFALSGATTWPPDYIRTLAEDRPHALFGPSLPWDPDQRRTSAEAVLEGPLFEDIPTELRAALTEDWPCLQLAHDVLEDDRFNADTAGRLIEEQSPPFLAVYWNGVDALSHRIERHQKRDPRYRMTVDRYYEQVDILLGTLLAKERERTTYIVVSDHGWSYAPEQYGHYHAPQGMLLVAGFQALEPDEGKATSASPAPLAEGTPHIEDIAPTVLHLFGLPASDEMPGRVLNELLKLRPEAPRIPSWGSHAPQFSEFADALDGSLTAEDQLEKLRALGYVK